MYLDGDNSYVASISIDGLSVCLKYGFKGWLCGSYHFCKYALAVFVAYCYNLSWMIGSLPLQVSVLGHLLPSQLLAVDGQLHFVAVAVGPQVDLLALMARKVPVGEDVERGLIGPPRLQIPGLIFPETAVVQDAEL